ncbi:MAG: ABC transporter permease [Cryomorphaceae bacterium]|nr:MAG: ABC transporter permease [Cryomorphaceae bacterium]
MLASLTIKKIPLYISVLIISLFFFISVFCYFIIPDKTINANSINLTIKSQKPGFKKMFFENVSVANSAKDLFFGSKKISESYTMDDYEIINDSIIKIINYDESKKSVVDEKIILINKNSNIHNNVHQIERFIIEKKFIFGTDIYGRDLFSRIILGTRVSFSIGLMAVFISNFIGILLGLVSGYYGGYTDKVIVWIINVFWSIPTLLMVIALSLALGKGFWQIYIAIGLSIWVDVARLVRGKVISEKNKDYIFASKVLGYNDIKILLHNILPNIISPILIFSAANFASSILLESGLSFLGIGSQPPTPSWGYMIKENYQYIIFGNSYLIVIPSIFLISLVISFYYLSNYFASKNL